MYKGRTDYFSGELRTKYNLNARVPIMVTVTRLPRFIEWITILMSLVTPILPARLYFFANNTSVDKRFMLFIACWLTLGAISIFFSWSKSHQLKKQKSNLAYICYFLLCFVPVFLSQIWLFSSPALYYACLKILAVSSLIPLFFDVLWKAVFVNLTSGSSWTEVFLLPFISVFVTIAILEVTCNNLSPAHTFDENMAANSVDRSYWYILRKIGPDGVNIANSFGFIGPEPETNYSGIRVLLIGDSIPAAGRSVNFPKVAQSIFEQSGYKGQIEILNASFGGYSSEQIKRYYAGKLKGLRHSILIVSFYIADINRELRYRKNNYLYNPAWPEWMQDVYYNCFFCRLLLNTNGFTEKSFLYYRSHSLEDSFTGALKIIDEIRGIAENRGAKVGIFNIPNFNWSGNLAELSRYKYLEMNKKLEEWCRIKSIPYHDVLPTLIGKDIRQFRISDTNVHFNDRGHQLVGIELKSFLDTLIATDS